MPAWNLPLPSLTGSRGSERFADSCNKSETALKTCVRMGAKEGGRVLCLGRLPEGGGSG